MKATVHQLQVLDVHASLPVPGRIAVLGQPTIDGRTLTPQQRVLVSVLALHRDRGATLAFVVDVIWPHGAPGTARSSLQNQITRLRRTFGNDIIMHDRGRYRLGCSTDLDAFDMLAHRWVGVPPSPFAIIELQAALGLWRGNPFDDLSDDPAAEVEQVRLQFLRERCFEALIAARLLIGEPVTAIGELTHHTVSAPFHERPWELLLLALHLAGRRSDALLAFRRHASILREELGVGPSQMMGRLRQAIVDEMDLTVEEGLRFIGIELAPTSLAVANASS